MKLKILCTLSELTGLRQLCQREVDCDKERNIRLRVSQ